MLWRLFYVSLYLGAVYASVQAYDAINGVEWRRRRKLQARRTKFLSRNPFQGDDEMNVLDWIEFIGYGLVLVPFRIAVMLLAYMVAIPLTILTAVGADTSRPLSPDRLWLQLNLNRFFGSIIAPFLGVQVTVKGKIAPREECCLFVAAPHSALFDVIATGRALSGELICSVGKKELESNWIMARALAAQQNIMVDRSDAEDAARAKRRIQQRARPNNRWGKRLLIFAEGTTTNRTSLIRFRSGAFIPGEPVQPIVLHWEHAIGWTKGSTNRALLAIRSIAQPRTRVTAEFLPVYYPTAEEKTDPYLFAKNVRSYIAKRLNNISVTEFSFKDSSLASMIGKRKLQVARVMPFSLQALSEELDEEGLTFSAEEMFQITKECLRIFLQVADAGKDRITERQFNQASILCAQQFSLKSRNEGLFTKSTMPFHTFLLAQFHAIHDEKPAS